MDLHEISKYMITEESAKNTGCKYIVHNLIAETEDGGVYFGDTEDIILSNQYALIGFLVSSVKDIIFVDNVINIIFETNTIKIELIA